MSKPRVLYALSVNNGLLRDMGYVKVYESGVEADKKRLELKNRGKFQDAYIDIVKFKEIVK